MSCGIIISNRQFVNTVIVPGKVISQSCPLRAGVFSLNGARIAIATGDSLKKITDKINSHKNITGIEAKLCDGRLQLQSRKQLVNIVDYDNVLKNFYNNREIGCHDNCLIQIVRIGSNSSDIIIKYTAGTNSNVNYNSNVVSGGNMLALAEMRYNDLPPAPVLDADSVENDEVERLCPLRCYNLSRVLRGELYAIL